MRPQSQVLLELEHMPKTRTKFVCQQCESQYPTSYGRCPNCGSWNSMVETVEAVASSPVAPTAHPRTARLSDESLRGERHVERDARSEGRRGRADEDVQERSDVLRHR